MKNIFKNYLSFTYKIIISHFLTYFIIGFIFFLLGINSTSYYAKHPVELVTLFHRDTNSIWVLAGPLFQILRAILFSIALFPIKNLFIEKKNGWLYLWLVFIVFAIFAPCGESPGSIEGIVYTNLPMLFHLLYFPELVIQTLLFSILFILWEKGKLKRIITILLSVISFILILMTIVGMIQNNL